MSTLKIKEEKSRRKIIFSHLAKKLDIYKILEFLVFNSKTKHKTRQTFKHIIWTMPWSVFSNQLNLIHNFHNSTSDKKVDQNEISISSTPSSPTDQRLPQRPHHRPLRHEKGPQRGNLQSLFEHLDHKVRDKTKCNLEKDNFQIARVNVKVSLTSALLHLSPSVSCCFKLNFLSKGEGRGGFKVRKMNSFRWKQKQCQQVNELVN